MIRTFRRWLYTASLTRIAADLAAARENKEEDDRMVDNLVDMRWQVPDAFWEGRRRNRERLVALIEEQQYVEGELAKVISPASRCAESTSHP